MNNNEKIKKFSKPLLSSYNNDIKISNLNNSFQYGNNKLKLENPFLEKIYHNNFKKSIMSKISQLQLNQQKTNLKLSSIITILLSKLVKIQNYAISHSNFSILKPIKIINNNNNNNNNNEIKQYIESHLNNETKKEKNDIENNIEEKNKNTINNTSVRKIGTISLETQLEIRRYTLSSQKTKTKEQIFKNKEKKDKKKNNEENNFYNNLFKINYNDEINKPNEDIENKKNDYYYTSLNKNTNSENLKISKHRKPIAFNDTNQNNSNRNYNTCGINEINKIVFSENNENKRVYINALNIHNNSSHNINNKSNISESKSTKGPVRIKFNQTEKPILLINHNKNNSENKIELRENKNSKDFSKNIQDKKLTLQIEDLAKNQTINQEDNNDDIKIRRKYSESKSEAEINLSHLSDTKQKDRYSRKIRGFNFRNNIKYNKSQISDDKFYKIRGGSMRYDNNESLFSQINSIEN